MFGIGYQEMFVVLVVAMIIFGPKRLPELAGQVGRWVRDFRRMSSDLTGEFEKTFAEVEEVKKSFKREFDAIQGEVESVGKGTRGDSKKPLGKSPLGAKKPAALNVGSKAIDAKAATANEAEAKPLVAAALKTAADKNGSAKSAPAATKADPLIDVSLFDVDFIAIKSGSIAANGKASPAEDDALSRVRRRRAAASYGRRVSA
jgi:sec-independent protein translocase protein TatA